MADPLRRHDASRREFPPPPPARGKEQAAASALCGIGGHEESRHHGGPSKTQAVAMTDTSTPAAADTTVIVPVVAAAPPASPQAPFWVKLLIVAFVLCYLSGALWLLLDAWVLGLVNLRRMIGVAPDALLPPVFLSALHAMLGAVLGAGALDIVSFHKYASVKGDFQTRHVWGYFVAPLLAAVLGLVVFALLQSGLLVFAGGAKDKADDLARLGYLAVGFLAGFGWYEATESIQRIVKRFFSSGEGKVAVVPATVLAGLSPATPSVPATATPSTMPAATPAVATLPASPPAGHAARAQPAPPTEPARAAQPAPPTEPARAAQTSPPPAEPAPPTIG